MKEIIVNYNNQKKDVIVVDDGVVVEKYQELDSNKTIEGNIYLGKVIDVLPGMQAAFVDIGEEKNAFLHIKDVLPKASDITGNKNEKLSKSKITDFIKVGMPVVVQVKKDRTETKGARVSLDLNIAGRYVALVSNSSFITVSSKIEEKSEVERLKNIIKEDNCNSGVIIRTAAKNVDSGKIKADIENLKHIYSEIELKKEKNIKNNIFPVKLYESGGIINNVILGLIDKIDRITVNNKEIYDYIINSYVEISELVVMDSKPNIIPEYVMCQIEKFKNRKIWLDCGGFITIDKTEALTAIDVNTGKYIGKESLEQTVLKVNEEASIEIAKQIRARDIGVIIIIDYIDMEEKEHEEKVKRVLAQELKKDRAKTQIIDFTPLHLLEMTRKHLYSN